MAETGRPAPTRLTLGQLRYALTSLPGFMMLAGSRARLTRRISSSAARGISSNGQLVGGGGAGAGKEVHNLLDPSQREECSLDFAGFGKEFDSRGGGLLDAADPHHWHPNRLAAEAKVLSRDPRNPSERDSPHTRPVTSGLSCPGKK